MDNKVLLNTRLRAQVSIDLEETVKSKVIGQDKAVERMVQVLSRKLAGLNKPRKPLASMLFIGPTGVGKTRVCEALAEAMFGSPDALLKINCGELQDSQASLKFMGSAPGYVGYTDKEENMYISQTKLDAHQSEKWPVNIIVLDEIEKAHDNVFRLLLGVLDKGTLNLNNSKQIDFTKTIIFMTSNLGAQEASKYINNKIGFGYEEKDDHDKVTASITSASVKKKFTPEFINRIDEIINFKSLERSDMEEILEVECQMIQRQIMGSSIIHPFTFHLDAEAKDYLLTKGTSKEYGARELNRTLDKEITDALTVLILTKQLEIGDVVSVTVLNGELHFSKDETDFEVMFVVPAQLLNNSE